MSTARYVVGVLLLMSLPPGIVLWYVIHPLIRIWRRIGAGWTYAALSPFIAAWMIFAFVARDTLLVSDLGTHYLLLLPTAFCVVLGSFIAWKRRQQLTYRIVTGLPELSPQKHQGKLVTEGLYAAIRHPRYVEVLLFTAAYALFANHVGSYIAATLSVPALYLVVLLEEKELRDRFGRAYEEYCQRVPRFIPRSARD